MVVASGAALWALPMGWLTLQFGWDHTLTQMGWFFTKAALLTFGGAYAVLPYVFQGAVGHYGWLTPTQMMDGLALGETTPGPLIMVVAFVGFVGGYVKAVFGPDQLVSGRRRGSHTGDLVHLFALVCIHSGRRPAGRDHAHDKLKLHRTAHCHYRCRGGCDLELGAVLRLPPAVAARFCRPGLTRCLPPLPLRRAWRFSNTNAA